MSAVIGVVVVDESPIVCRLLTSFLEAAPDLRVVGTARTGDRALDLVKALRPQAVTLALELPGMSRLEALQRIMEECPTPVVLISGVSRRAAAVTLRALELGAVDFILKYSPGADTDPGRLQQEIVSRVRMAARIKVIRSLRPRLLLGRGPGPPPRPAPPRKWPEPVPEQVSRRPAAAPTSGGMVVIGASTGGPLALRELLANLPANFPGGILVVQHMPASFTGVLAARLNRQVRLSVREARDGDLLEAGLVLVAPGDYHLLVRPDGHVELSRGPEIGGNRPSVDVTMQSAAQVFGPRTRAVVLTGMGHDGTQGLVAVRSKGGTTFAQDAASCVVNGMPQRAVDAGVVDHIASPAGIARLLEGELG